MKNDLNIPIKNIFNDIKDRISLSTKTDTFYVPNIIEFCESKKYLNLGQEKIKLYPFQRIILKIFYRGQKGNENLRLNEEELDILRQEKMDQVIQKYNSGSLFRELVLVLGRRGGKDFLTSLIALYEAMMILECPGGNPFQYYELASGNPICILTVATSGDQAKVLFNEIRTRMQQSEYFRNKIGKMESDRIFLLTPDDKEKNKKFIESEFTDAVSPGSVMILSGHSNSDGLLGKRLFALLLDEVASFKSTGQLSGDRIYSALTPATADFKSPGKIKEGSITEENPEGLPVYDSKIISISSPRAEEGILYRMYKEAGDMDERLAFRASTWKVSLKFKEESLRHEFKLLSAIEFNMEFGAEFSGTAGELFLPAQYIDDAAEIGRRIGLTQRLAGQPGLVYYAHLDPASSSHIYALVIIHVEERLRVVEKENGIKVQEKIKMFVVDHIKTWMPTVNKSVKIAEVDEYIINIAKRFRFAMVSYDAFNSISSIQKLRSKGIPSKLTEFRPKYKVQIYQYLEHLFVSHAIALPTISSDAQLLIQELKHLKRIYNATGFRITPDPEAAVKTDDLCDAIAGACGTATNTIYTGYAKGTTAFLPQSQAMNSEQWKIGRGVYNNQTWKNTFGR